MTDKNIASAEAYYIAVVAKDFSSVKKMLAPDVTLTSPLAKVSGLDKVFPSIEKFGAFLKDVRIQAKCGSGDQVMLAYEMHCPEPIGSFRAACLMTFKDHLIQDIELYYDPRPFEKLGIFASAQKS